MTLYMALTPITPDVMKLFIEQLPLNLQLKLIYSLAHRGYKKLYFFTGLLRKIVLKNLGKVGNTHLSQHVNVFFLNV